MPDMCAAAFSLAHLLLLSRRLQHCQLRLSHLPVSHTETSFAAASSREHPDTVTRVWCLVGDTLGKAKKRGTTEAQKSPRMHVCSSPIISTGCPPPVRNKKERRVDESKAQERKRTPIVGFNPPPPQRTKKRKNKAYGAENINVHSRSSNTDIIDEGDAGRESSGQHDSDERP